MKKSAKKSKNFENFQKIFKNFWKFFTFLKIFSFKIFFSMWKVMTPIFWKNRVFWPLFEHFFSGFFRIWKNPVFYFWLGLNLYGINDNKKWTIFFQFFFRSVQKIFSFEKNCKNEKTDQLFVTRDVKKNVFLQILQVWGPRFWVFDQIFKKLMIFANFVIFVKNWKKLWKSFKKCFIFFRDVKFVIFNSPPW